MKATRIVAAVVLRAAKVRSMRSAKRRREYIHALRRVRPGMVRSKAEDFLEARVMPWRKVVGLLLLRLEDGGRGLELK
jgi:hypothetical protein